MLVLASDRSNWPETPKSHNFTSPFLFTSTFVGLTSEIAMREASYYSEKHVPRWMICISSLRNFSPRTMLPVIRPRTGSGIPSPSSLSREPASMYSMQ